ncbi:EI24 domain-containing protein [Propioniferax innocua]|uniref:CysZ protein n=1 Tax=Propioniferax innocua TaxID=1753 RepID=A0A542ZRU2_9ACTN|nr:EI24 domain-containing protein [Propioniferax innocua]TQL63052.1 CysZ protein [Propioniferax innocua]
MNQVLGRSQVHGVAGGVGCLVRGFGVIASQPRLFVLGMVPPLVMSVLLIGVWVALVMNAGAMAGAVLDWMPGDLGGGVLQVLLAIALVVGAVLVSVVAYSTLTITLGAPVYDAISAGVDRTLGAVPPEHKEPTGRMIVRVIWQVIATVFLSMAGAVLCFLLGLIPAVGAVLGVVASSVFGGWMMARELVGPTCERRGVLTLAERRAVLLRNAWSVLGFGVPAYWLLSVPLLSVVVFPAAVAGATVLARDLLD